MKHLKQLLFVLTISLIFFGCSSSESEDNCVPPALSENIIGKFQPEGETEIIEFKSDGTLLDPTGAFVSENINGTELDQKTWALSGETLIVTLATSSGLQSTIEFEIIQNECDRIVFDIFIPYSIFKRS